MDCFSSLFHSRIQANLRRTGRIQYFSCTSSREQKGNKTRTFPPHTERTNDDHTITTVRSRKIRAKQRGKRRKTGTKEPKKKKTDTDRGKKKPPALEQGTESRSVYTILALSTGTGIDQGTVGHFHRVAAIENLRKISDFRSTHAFLPHFFQTTFVKDGHID